jgi:uncharacterized protein (DUF924 family)
MSLNPSDKEDIHGILTYWFRERDANAPRLDSRMDMWFGNDPDFDRELKSRFGELVERASRGELNDWASIPLGRLALILLIDQFRRNIYRGSRDAFSLDRAALKLCVEGAIAKHDQKLSALQRAFFYMPMQHAESLRVQNKSVAVFAAIARAVGETQRETFEAFLEFAELHRDIVEQFGRFPHRNKALGRASTPEELAYLGEDAPNFGQG